MNARELTLALGGKWHGNGGRACCPAHDDHVPSLDITSGKVNETVFVCRAGCGQAAVIAALQDRGLWENGDGRRAQRAHEFFRAKLSKTPPHLAKNPPAAITPAAQGQSRMVPKISSVDIKPTVVATYDYVATDGTPLRKQRREPGFNGHAKSFAWQYVSAAGFGSGRNGKVPRLYRHDSIDAAGPGDPIFIAESERSADLLSKHGLFAVSPGGSSGWRPEYAEDLADAAVFVLPDNDEPGRKLAASIMDGLPKAVTVELTALPAAQGPDHWPHWQSPGGAARLRKIVADRTTPVTWRTKVRRLDLASLDTQPIPVRQWIIKDWAGVGWPVALTGLGGRGKTTIAQTAATCVAIEQLFFGNEVAGRNAIVITGEESLDDLHIRQAAINEYFGINFARLSGHFELLSLRGDDMTCFAISPKSGSIEVTDVWKLFREIVLDTKAGFVFLDHWGLMVAGPEGDRHATGAVISRIGGLADEAQGVIVFAQHPSKAAGAEYSGNTGFDGGVRCRWTMEEHSRKEDENAPAQRVLKIGKANYSAETSITLEWRNGLFLPVADKLLSPVETMAKRARMNAAKDVFLGALARLASQQRTVSHKPSRTYAPKVMVEDGLADGFTVKEMKDAMTALFADGQLLADAEMPWKTNDRHRVYGLGLRANSSSAEDAS